MIDELLTIAGKINYNISITPINDLYHRAVHYFYISVREPLIKHDTGSTESPIQGRPSGFKTSPPNTLAKYLTF